MPVNIGTPREVSGLKDIVSNPIYATGVGLLLSGREEETRDRNESKPGGLLTRLGQWFRENV